ncbi:hypothetical protein [Dyadobacter frigoris]|uniref:Uncharacterized protein n=1 Tax=Dyadobacter frigoris TaxID=2576211 RepID=A0A4U6D3L0_9BACT|nr:hypothetical protein [Dyadobacter frigoris]TKT90721.1 hypothetical protein FDK13_17275 [Dyadobacter frigoris]
MKLVTIELKDKILEYIIETRNGAMFTIDDKSAEESFEISEGLLFSFLKELEQLGYIRGLVGYGRGDSLHCISNRHLLFTWWIFKTLQFKKSFGGSADI